MVPIGVVKEGCAQEGPLLEIEWTAMVRLELRLELYATPAQSLHLLDRHPLIALYLLLQVVSLVAEVGTKRLVTTYQELEHILEKLDVEAAMKLEGQ
jgi:hypothetical protein